MQNPAFFQAFCLLVRHTLVGAMLSLAAISAAQAQAQWSVSAGQVVRVADGDTLTVRKAEGQRASVRLFGVDAPETRCTPGVGQRSARGTQALGAEAHRFLRSKTEGRSVGLVARPTRSHGRIVARVLIDGNDVGEALLREGLACHYERFTRREPGVHALYARAQREAQAARRGMWALPEPSCGWLARG
jgi:endonuclease YncB( thermonuclease family)